MAGLLDKSPQGSQPGMGQQQPGMASQGNGMMPPGGAPPQSGMDEESTVSPEEQQSYDQFVSNGMQLIYSEQGLPQLLESISGGGDPIEGLANTLAMVVIRLEDSARDQGQEFSGDVKLNAATELMEQMVELAEQAGVHEYSQEDMDASLFRALDIYRSAREEQGTLPVEELTEDMQGLIQAEQEGRLEEVVPGITEYAKRAPKPEEMMQGEPQPNNQRR